jgi:alkanesulfonate monooxygenase SsuD/methylene tetrahydromethanopterin reductase-like flavin-dependent oxidoreductase (luciferase family)
MIRLAAEIADGIVLWACPPSYIRDVVVPEIGEVRRAAGLDLADFDVLAAVPSAATDDVDSAVKGIRAELHRYSGCRSTVRCSSRPATATTSPPSMQPPASGLPS